MQMLAGATYAPSMCSWLYPNQLSLGRHAEVVLARLSGRGYTSGLLSDCGAVVRLSQLLGLLLRPTAAS